MLHSDNRSSGTVKSDDFQTSQQETHALGHVSSGYSV